MLVTCKICGYEGPKENFVTDSSSKIGVQKKCKSCKKEQIYSWREDNREKYNSYQRNFRASNKEKVNAYDRARYQDPARKAQHQAATVARRARKLDQTPELTEAEKKRIQDLYWLAKDLKVVTGEEYHVDHIHPLSKGGLHHPDNLQILPSDLNLKKSDKVHLSANGS